MSAPAERRAQGARPARRGADTAARAPVAPKAAGAEPPAQAAAPRYLQARLAVSQAADPAEQEAERTARELVEDLRPGARPERAAARPGAAPARLFRVVERPPTAAAAGGGIAAEATPAAPPTVDAGTEARLAARQGGGAGEPLPEGLRAEMERRLGADLAAVRVHTDAEAAALCAQHGARAFTVGRDLYFAAGAWQPDTEPGRELLAHELVHVVQQQRAGATPALQRQGFDIARLMGRVRLQQAEQWNAAGPYPAAPATRIGADGRGGFDVQYRPAADGDGVLVVSQGVAVNFQPSFQVVGGTVRPNPLLLAQADAASTVRLNAYAAAIQALPPARRAPVLTLYAWNAADQAPWLAEAQSLVEGTWSGRHDFFLNQPQWRWIGARVSLRLAIGDRAQAASDHMTLTVFRFPEGQGLNSFGVDNAVQRGDQANARDQTGVVGSDTTRPTTRLLRASVRFPYGERNVQPAMQAELGRWAAAYTGAFTDRRHQRPRIALIGHTSAEGSEADNLALGQARADSVRVALQAHLLTAAAADITTATRGEAEADPRRPRNPADPRVDIVVDGGERQVVLPHEFGHALGLGDEYGVSGAVGTPGRIGDAVGHDALVQKMQRPDGSTLAGVVRENNAGVMSCGNEVRPHHYAVFHESLGAVTGRAPWALGLRTPRWRERLELGLPVRSDEVPPPGPLDAPGPLDPMGGRGGTAVG